jgi:hypothetical protein
MKAVKKPAKKKAPEKRQDETVKPARPRTLKEWLLADTPRGDLNIPPRKRWLSRPPPDFSD